MSEAIPAPPPYYPAPPQPPVQHRGPAGWMAPLALVISLLAAGAAGWALFNTAPFKSAPQPANVSNPAVADPTAKACSAFFLVSNGVALQSRLDVGPEPAAQQAVAANARLAMSGGAAYIRSNLPPNTPSDLAEALNSFADQLQTISQFYLAGQTNQNPEQAARLAAADEITKKLVGICKK